MQTVMNGCFTRKAPAWEIPSAESVIDGFAISKVSSEIFNDYPILWQAIKDANTAKEVDDIIQITASRGIVTDTNRAVDERKMKALYCEFFREAHNNQRSEVARHILTKDPTLISNYFGKVYYQPHIVAPMVETVPCIHLAVRNYAVFMEFVKRGADIYARSSTGRTTLQAYISRNSYIGDIQETAAYSVDYTITQWLLRHKVPITEIQPQILPHGRVLFNTADSTQSAAERFFVEHSLKKMLAEDMFLQGTLAPAIFPKDLRTHIWSFLTGIEHLNEKPYRIFQLTSAAYIEERNRLIALREQERKALFDALPEFPK